MAQDCCYTCLRWVLVFGLLPLACLASAQRLRDKPNTERAFSPFVPSVCLLPYPSISFCASGCDCELLRRIGIEEQSASSCVLWAHRQGLHKAYPRPGTPSMTSKYDVGTPVGGERKHRRINSPLTEMDDVYPTTLIFDNEQETETRSERSSRSSSRETNDLIKLFSKMLDDKFDEKLQPISTSISSLSSDMAALNSKVDENNVNINADILNMATDFDEFKNETVAKFEGIDKQINDMKDHLKRSPNMPKENFPKESAYTEGITGASKQFPADTLFVGGLGGFDSKTEAAKWIQDQLWWKYGPWPVDCYIKDETWAGKLFLKFASDEDAEKGLTNMKSLNVSYGNKDIFVKKELPFQARVSRSVLYAGKEVLVAQGFDKRALWADHEAQQLLCGGDVIYTIVIEHGELKVSFEKGWAEYLEKDKDFASAVSSAKSKVSASKPPTKGVGKGKTGGHRE